MDASEGATTTVAEPITRPRPVLVVGSSRSGTSMTAAALGLHTGVQSLPELHFFEHLWTASSPPLDAGGAVALAERLLHHARKGFYRPFVSGAHRVEAERLVESVPDPSDAVAIYRAVLTATAAGHRLVVDQTPNYVYWLPDILRALPDVRVLRLVRDPRDVLLSQRRWWRTLRMATGDVPFRITLRHWAQYHPVIMSLLWRSALAAGEVTDPRVLTVRFEDLVRAPKVELARICGHLGVPFEEPMLQVRNAGSSNSAALHTGFGFDPDAAGRGARELSPEELWVSHRINHTGAEQHGYEMAPTRPRPFALLLVGVRLPLAGFVALCANLLRTRSVRSSVRRRLVRGGV